MTGVTGQYWDCVCGHLKGRHEPPGGACCAKGCDCARFSRDVFVYVRTTAAANPGKPSRSRRGRSHPTRDSP